MSGADGALPGLQSAAACGSAEQDFATATSSLAAIMSNRAAAIDQAVESYEREDSESANRMRKPWGE